MFSFALALALLLLTGILSAQHFSVFFVVVFIIILVLLKPAQQHFSDKENTFLFWVSLFASDIANTKRL